MPTSRTLITTLGNKRIDEIGMILPHEHVFLDFRTCNQPGYAEANVEDVVRAMAPEINRARDAGVTLIVETTPVGLGRRADILQRLSETTGFPFVLATGSYAEPWTPPWMHAASETALTDWMLRELTEKIEGTNTTAGWIKLAVSDDGPTATETKLLRAAATAARTTNSTIGSHTVRGTVALQQLDLLEELHYPPERFIWFHASREPDFQFHLDVAHRGAWIEYDGIGRPAPKGGPDEKYINLILRAFDAGLDPQLLLSHDRLGYDPATGKIWSPSYNYLNDVFIPKLKIAGVGKDAIQELTHKNPFRAYATH